MSTEASSYSSLPGSGVGGGGSVNNNNNNNNNNNINGSSHHEGSVSYGDGDESPFFADMTLDLAEAHDIAETPEPTKRPILDSSAVMTKNIPHMPVIPDNGNPITTTTSIGHEATAAPPTSLITNTTKMPSINDIDKEEKANVVVGVSSVAAVESSTTTVSATTATIQKTDADDDDKNDDLLGSPRDLEGTLNSITNSSGGNGVLHAGGSGSGSMNKRLSTMTPSSKRYPKDVQWAVGFCIIVPLCLFLPMMFAKPSSSTDPWWLATAPSPRLATLHTLLWGFVASLILLRLLYRTMGGGDGDDARHFASQILLASAPISVSVYISLMLTMYFMTPGAIHYAIIPMWYLARDLYLFRQWKMTATTPGGRQAFFQALTCMTLDILSRSLRRSSFYRIMNLLVVIQFVMIAWWRLALLAALQSKSLIWITMAFVGGKWATGTVARLLSLIASGGICSWFAEQNNLVQELNDSGQEEMIEFTPLTNNNNTESGMMNPAAFDTKSDDGGEDNMPEAYRTASASAYKSAIIPDEGMDDDFDDEYYDGEGDLQPRSLFSIVTASVTSPGGRSAGGGSTVKQLLFAGLTMSFGSVAKCGLLGGVAQVIWSQLRKIDTARAAYRSHGGGGSSSTIAPGEGNQEEDENNPLNKYLMLANTWARNFVRCHSDMAMSHVAAYQKSYQRAALDVAALVDESGVESIIHDDISTHMSSCVGGSISGVIVIFTGSVLVHQRNRNAPDVKDAAVVIDMLLAFIFCYTLIFTVMEPLRASIKAVYVSFGQHPQSLSQSFPLIFHRLSRMSRSNVQ